MRKSEKMFLNDSVHEFGTLCYYAATPKEDEESLAYVRPNVDSELRLTDCNNIVVLEFSFSDEETYRKRMAKLDTMINALSNMRTSLTDCYEDMVSLQEKKAQLPQNQAREKLMAALPDNEETTDIGRYQIAEDAFMDMESRDE